MDRGPEVKGMAKSRHQKECWQVAEERGPSQELRHGESAWQREALRGQGCQMGLERGRENLFV